MADPPDPTTAPDNDDDPAPLVYAARPPTSGERALIDKFYEHLAGQSAQMDALARQMITVELAVPGLYATVLALLRGDKATLPGGPLLLLTFGGWGLALLFTFLALFPRRYRVDTSVLRSDPAAAVNPAANDAPLGIEDFFSRAATTKYRLLAAAALAFWVGIVAAIVVLF